MLVAALVVVGAVVGTSVYREREAVDHRERERLLAQTAAITELLTHQFEAAGTSLQGVLEDLPGWTRGGELESVGRNRLLDLERAMPTIRTILVTDARGVIVASSRPEVVGRDVSAREYFRVPRSRPDPNTLYVSAPFRSSLGAWTFNLTRPRIGDASGAFEGVVTASVDAEQLRFLFGATRYAPDMRVSLVSDDGTLVVTVPPVDGLEGKDLSVPGSLFTKFRDSGLEASVQSGALYSTGETRMTAHRLLRPAALHADAALVVAASRELELLHAPWRADAARAAGLLVLLVVGSTSALSLDQRRRQRSEARIAEAEARARETRQTAERFAQATLDAMPDQVCVLDGDGTIVSVNASWRAFAETNGGEPSAVLPGRNYLEVCLQATGPHAEEAAPFAEELRQVLAGQRRAFSLEYPCHAPAEQRWFIARVTRFDDGPLPRVVVAHQSVTELKRSHQAHRLTTARFEAALANSSVVVFNQDRELRYSWIHNPALGYQAEQVLGLRDTDIFERAEDAAATEAMKREVLATSQRRRREVVVHDQGVPRTYDLTVEPQRDGDGATVGVMCVAVDITERKQIERRLADALAANLRLIEATPAGILVYQAGTGQCVLANPAAQAMVGATEAQLLAQRFGEIESWRRSGLLAVAEAALETGAGQHVTVKVTSTFGRDLWLQCFLTRFERTDGTHLQLLFNDLTARVQAEEALRSVSAQLSSVLNGTRDGIAMMDAGLRYTVFNEAFHAEYKRIYGADLRPGDSMLALALVPGDLATVKDCWDRALGGEDFTVVQELGDPDLGRTWYELHFTPVRDQDGKVSSAVQVVRNITERRLAEEALRTSQALLGRAERLAATATLARGMAHEINNPLASVVANINYARERLDAARGTPAAQTSGQAPVLVEEVREAIGDAAESAGRIRDIVSDLRAFALGDFPSGRAAATLAEAVQDARRVAGQELARCRSVEVAVDGVADLALGHSELVQVLAHILLNAGQASGPGPNDVKVEAVASGSDRVVIRVSDTGLGMDAPTQARAIEPFFTTKDVGKGRGLGLSVCVGIVQAVGGELSISSAAGVGTTVTIVLPRGIPRSS